jgi:glycosidase
LLGEIWHDSTPWLLGDEYDAVMNYPFTSSVNDFWKENLTAKQFEHAINRCMNLYREQNQKVMFNLLDSHDTDRLRTRCGSEDIFYQQMALLFTMAGSACIYYGTEIAMEGGHDPDCRRCMPWEEIEKGTYEKELMAIKTLIEMRKKEEATHSLSIQFLYRDEEAKKERVIHYKKDQNFYVLLNATNKPILLKEYIKDSDTIERFFQWNCKESVLEVNGTLIYKKN